MVIRAFAYLKQKQNLLLTAYSFLMYLWLIFEKLTTFPAYFFCDEAVLGVEAHAILTTGADRFGVKLPFFFKSFGAYENSLNIYFQIPSIVLFGLNELAIRLTTACISLIGVLAVYLLMRHVFDRETAWLTFPIFALSPLWFLHSRTGFQGVLATSFFLAFVFFYILSYRRHAAFVLPAVLCGAITFYLYTSARGWVIIALLLLSVVNILEHLRYWKRTLLAIALLLLLLAPYIHFHLTHPEMAMSRFSDLNNSEMSGEHNVSKRVASFVKNYALGFNPFSWYTWNGTQKITQGGERHFIPQLPALFVGTFPFAFLGFCLVIARIRAFEYRTLIAVLLAAPFPSALLTLNTHRAMPVGAIMLIFSLIGAGGCFHALRQRTWARRTLKGMMAVGVGIYALWFQYHVYRVVPDLYKDYGFYGLQMGAPEVFHWIRQQSDSYEKIYVAYDLFNAGEIYIPFYLQGDAARKTSIFNADEIYKSQFPLGDNAVYIVPASFIQKLQDSNIPIKRQVVNTIPDLKGKPLIEILQLQREPAFDDWLRAEHDKRGVLLKTTVNVGQISLPIEYPMLDIGRPQEMFDGKQETLTRTAEINPARVIAHLPNVNIKRVAVTVSHCNRADVTVKTRANDAEQDWGTQSWGGGQVGILTFTQAEAIPGVTTLEILVHVDADEYGFVHIHEISWD